MILLFFLCSSSTSRVSSARTEVVRLVPDVSPHDLRGCLLGKSNVIDSLLFVIGHRASKMRGAKLSTLLHNSAECPHVKSCSVTVHFEAIAIEGVRQHASSHRTASFLSVLGEGEDSFLDHAHRLSGQFESL